MINRSHLTFIVLFFGLYSAVALADGCPTINGPNPLVVTPASPQNYSGPEDGIPHGELIGSGFSGDITAGEYFITCNVAPLESSISPVKSPIGGVKYNDGSNDYDVFDSGVPGIGYAVGVADVGTGPYVPMLYPTTITASGGTSRTRGFRVRIVFVATGHLTSGSSFIPAQTIGTISAVQPDGQSNQAPVNITGVTVNVTSTGCNVTSSNNASINLGDILPAAFSGVGSLAGSGSTTLSLQCDAGVQLWASMSDASNPANTSQTLSLTPDSAAQGVGIQFFANNSPTPVTFGPDSSSKGLPNAFFIDNSTGDGSVITFPIMAKYIQTGRLAPGPAKGIATVTFSYQ